jgi:hypothetical protein
MKKLLFFAFVGLAALLGCTPPDEPISFDKASIIPHYDTIPHTGTTLRLYPTDIERDTGWIFVTTFQPDIGMLATDTYHIDRRTIHSYYKSKYYEVVINFEQATGGNICCLVLDPDFNQIVCYSDTAWYVYP